jgi:signal transduction histidine kinase
LAHSFNQMAASLRKSQEELKRTYIELAEKEKMAALGLMTAGIAHELKNPLGVILGSAQVVANKDRPWSMREEAADFIIHEIARLNKTLKALLDFSKPALPCFSIADPIQLLEEMLVAYEAQLNDNGIEVQKDICPGKGLCSVDKDQIRQVLWNIILNAAQAMPNGGFLRVTAGYRSIQSHDENPYPPMVATGPSRHLIISIRDSGKGIAPDQMDKIFDPFVSYYSDGIGLGLSIVKQILKLHRARIDVSSNLAQGTTVTLKFECVENHEEENIQSTYR